MRANAAKTYLGSSCKRGHDGKRYVSNGQCVECAVARQQARYRERPEECKAYTAAYQRRPELAGKRREYARRSLYGMEPTEYNFRLAGQQFRCELCGTDDPGHARGWHTDHCHETDRVRGILCHGCNSSLGKLGDTPEALLRAYLYTIGEFSWTNLTPPTSAMDGLSKHSPPTAPNESKQAGWSAGML